MELTNDTPATKPLHHPRRRTLWLLLAIPVALAAGVGAFKAHAMAGGFGMGPGGFGGGDPEQHRAFMERRLDRALDVVKATESQRTAIKNIFARTFAELRPVHQEHRRLHDAIATAFAAPTIDRAGIENLRVQTTKLVDQASQIFSKALLDASDVLSAEQRKALVEHLQEMHGRRPHGF